MADLAQPDEFDAAVQALVAVCCSEGLKFVEAFTEFGDFYEQLRAELGCGDDAAQILAEVRGLKRQLAGVRGALEAM